MTDSELERRIEAAVQHCAAAWHEDEYRTAWRELVKLIEQRTPAQVKLMERDKGLA